MNPNDGAVVAPPEAVALRRNAAFRMLWIGQLLSDTGSNVATLAYPLLILALTHSALIAGAVGTVSLLVQLLLRLPAGALSDRLDRRLTMIVCDSCRVLLMALLVCLLVFHLASWPIVLLIAVLEGAGSVIFDPASTAALPGVVPAEQLEAAWAATEARTYASSLAGPALGGLFFGLGRMVPFLGDGVSYAISAGTVWRIRGRFKSEQRAERKSLLHEALDGVRLVWATAILRAVAIQAPLVNFAFNGVIFTITLALRRNGTSAGLIGLVQAAIAVGGLLGALLAPKLQGRLSISALVVTLCCSGTILFGLAAVLTPSPYVALPVAVTLLLAPTTNAALFALMLRTTPEEMRGRVNNTVLMLATGLAALAPLVAGVLVAHLSGRWAIGLFALVLGLAAVMAIALPGLRSAERQLAESGADAAPAGAAQ